MKLRHVVPLAVALVLATSALVAFAHKKPTGVAPFLVTKAASTPSKPDIPLTQEQAAQLMRYQVLMQDRIAHLQRAQILLDAAAKAAQETQSEARVWAQALTKDHPGYRLDEAAGVLTATPPPHR